MLPSKSIPVNDPRSVQEMQPARNIQCNLSATVVPCVLIQLVTREGLPEITALHIIARRLIHVLVFVVWQFQDCIRCLSMCCQMVWHWTHCRKAFLSFQ